MTERPMTVDIDSIHDLLERFCQAMHDWELEMNGVNRRWRKEWRGKSSLPESHPYWKEKEDSRQQLSVLFKTYCTEWDSPGRAGSFANPPDYDPEHFEILEVKVRGKKATAKVRELEDMDDLMVYTYYLCKIENGWRLEDRRDYVSETFGYSGKTTL